MPRFWTQSPAFSRRDWSGEGVLNLSDHLIIVPTRNAGRRLRESLAVFAADKGAAVFPPLVTTPDFLTSPDRLPNASVPTIDRETNRLVWAATLMGIDLRSFSRLFPAEPVTRDPRLGDEKRGGNSRCSPSSRRIRTQLCDGNTDPAGSRYGASALG